MNCFVVSPNVKNGYDDANDWKSCIRRTGCAYMGWGPKDNGGASFHHEVKKDDVIIVAQRQDWNWECVIAGIVISDAEYKDDAMPSEAWARQLHPVLSADVLKQLKVDALLGQVGGMPKSRNPGAIFELKDALIKNKLVSELKRIEQKECMNAKVNDVVGLLRMSKNMILTGAPGTGKTFLAKQIAQKFVFGDDWTCVDERKLSSEDKKRFDAQARFVQFHPSYDYTDFVEGLRPMKSDENGRIGFERRDGGFKEFCDEALQACEYKADGKFDEDNSPKYIFIIDEINRGEISKIFGELFFSIEPSYRGEKGKVQTQYTNLIEDGDAFKDGFYVPENVYIIGTMNDIDRSVESFDFAMRRRFVWKEITAADSAERMELPDEIKTRMANLNAAIEKVEGLNASYHIGGAYFLKMKDNKENAEDCWKYHLKPLLCEYLRGMPNEANELDKLKTAYDGGVEVIPDEARDTGAE